MIESFVSIPECIESLQCMVKNFKDLTVKNSSEERGEDETFEKCLSISDIENSNIFKYNNSGLGHFICKICEVKVSNYGIELENNFHGKKQTKSEEKFGTTLAF